jgi:stage II sporulation protein D
VLPPEIGRLGKDAFEALKAQAVAARTYAYSRIKANTRRHYDLVNSIMDQVYIGIEGEYKLANKAIDETHGRILVHDGDPITAYYHSTCGGKTEDVDNAWDKHNSPYLKSVDDGGHCEWSKFYSWSMTWEPEELAGNLREYLSQKREFNGSPLVIEDIKILERFPSGRISHLAVETDKGEFLFFKDHIRWAFRRPGRPDLILPSSNFDIRLWRDQEGRLTEITAEGQGYGHGVGMCQTGAIGRARAGQKYETILKTYYTGAQIEQVY